MRVACLQSVEGLGDLRSGDTGLFQMLSSEIFLHICLHLGYAEQLKLATMVCKSFRCLLYEPSLWSSVGFCSGQYSNSMKPANAVSQCLGSVTVKASERIAKLQEQGTAITSLSLCNMTDPRDIKNALVLAGPTLKHLYLGGKKITSAVFQTATKHINGDLLESMHLGHDLKFDSGAAILSLLKKCTNLKSFCVLDTVVSAESVANALSSARGGCGVAVLTHYGATSSWSPRTTHFIEACAKNFPELKSLAIACLTLPSVDSLPADNKWFTTLRRLTRVEITSLGRSYGLTYRPQDNVRETTTERVNTKGQFLAKIKGDLLLKHCWPSDAPIFVTCALPHGPTHTATRHTRHQHRTALLQMWFSSHRKTTRKVLQIYVAWLGLAL